jgi:hypothetical protein
MAGKLKRSLQGGVAILDNFVLAFFTDRARRVRFMNSVVGFARHERMKHKFPTEELPAMLAGSPGITLQFADLTHEPGNISLAELSVLAALVRVRNARRVFEFGTFNGNTAYHFALNTELDAQIITVDIPPGATPALRSDVGDVAFRPDGTRHYRWYGSPVAAKIHPLLVDSACLDVEPYRQSIDLVFVDGAHSMAYIRNDTALALQMLRPGGIIVWHDYLVWNDVTSFLQEFCTEHKLTHVASTSLVIFQAP